MKKALSGLIAGLFVIAMIVGSCSPRIVYAAPGSSISAYCSPPNTIQNGTSHPVDAVPVQADLVYGAKCPGQPGDLFTDGVVSVTPALTGISGLNFTIPDNVFYAGGARVHASSASFTADPSTTDYLYLSTNSDEGTWTKSTSATPPANTVLEYTITTGASSITGETDPTFASLILVGSITAGAITGTSLTDSGLASGKCVQTSTGGLLTATASACGAGGGGISTLVAGQNITLTPSSGTASSETVADTVTPGPQATPSPSATGCITHTGSWPYTDDTTGCASLTTANAFSNAQAIEFNAAANCGSGSTIAELCILGTSTAGMVIGPVTGSYTTGTGNSQQLTFCKILSGTVNCGAFIQFTSGGTFQFGGASVSTGNQNLTTGSGTFTTTKLLQNATKNYAGQCSMVAATTCTATITASYTTPICWAQDLSGFVAAHCSVSSTTVTVTASSSNSDTFNFLIVGNPT